MPKKIRAQDEKAKLILETAFPRRKVVMLDALAVNLDGGGLHCITMHHPMLVLN
jgi:agmatine deiminase